MPLQLRTQFLIPNLKHNPGLVKAIAAFSLGASLNSLKRLLPCLSSEVYHDVSKGLLIVLCHTARISFDKTIDRSTYTRLPMCADIHTQSPDIGDMYY